MLFITSTLGTAFGLTVLGIYMMFKTWKYDVESYNWIALASFSFVIFIASWAILTLPFLIISEVMPDHLKEFGVSILNSLLWSFSFAAVKFLPFLSDALGFHGALFLFAGVCLCCTVFIMLRIPETKGKNKSQIMNLL